MIQYNFSEPFSESHLCDISPAISKRRLYYKEPLIVY